MSSFLSDWNKNNNNKKKKKQTKKQKKKNKKKKTQNKNKTRKKTTTTTKKKNNNYSFARPVDVRYKNMERIYFTASEEMSFENVDKRTDVDGRRIPTYTISSPKSLRLRWAKTQGV